jgi:CBS domain-containing protein
VSPKGLILHQIPFMNPVASKLAETLRKHPPFSKLSEDDLQQIALHIKVINLEKNKTLFKVNDALHQNFYMVASGVINLTIIVDAEEKLLNKCVSGDIFGLRPFFARNNYMMTAKAREESLVFAIPIAEFRPYVANNQDVLNFLLESFATNTQDPEQNRGQLLSDNIIYNGQPADVQYIQSLTYNKAPLKVQPSVLVQNAAQIMTDNLMDSVIVIEDNLPIGIITDADLRSKIATGRFPVSSLVTKVMSAPVITVPESITLAEAQLLLLKHNVSHLCVTADGSEKSHVIGVISQRDLIVSQASNPGLLIKEINRATTPQALQSARQKLSQLIQSSISKNIPITHIWSIAGEINLALIRRAVELAILELGSPPARFAWLSIGSQGRKEQLLLTDQDSILVFDDVAPEKYRDVKDYFLKLAKRTTATLEFVGYLYCPNGHMASNMLWCKSISDWIKQYGIWMKSPKANADIASIFFDYELAAGDAEIEEMLTAAVFENLEKNTIFYDYLGNDTLRKPAPLNFFKKFNVEEVGEFEGKFDIKTRGLMSLIDGARLMTMSQGIRGINNTYLRFKQLAMVDRKHAEIYQNCADAFLTLSRIRTEEGMKSDTNGQFINLEDLSKTDKEKMRAAVGVMKDLEELIKDTFRLTQFS